MIFPKNPEKGWIEKVDHRPPLPLSSCRKAEIMQKYSCRLREPLSVFARKAYHPQEWVRVYHLLWLDEFLEDNYDHLSISYLHLNPSNFVTSSKGCANNKYNLPLILNVTKTLRSRVCSVMWQWDGKYGRRISSARHNYLRMEWMRSQQCCSNFLVFGQCLLLQDYPLDVRRISSPQSVSLERQAKGTTGEYTHSCLASGCSSSNMIWTRKGFYTFY